MYIYCVTWIVQSSKDSSTGAQIPMTKRGTPYLASTQEEKKTLLDQGCGVGEGSRVMTDKNRPAKMSSLFRASPRNSKNTIVPHAVVAVTRHTHTYVYYLSISIYISAESGDDHSRAKL